MTPNRDVLLRRSALEVGELAVNGSGCHVWRGSTYGPCHEHGTVGCCLVAHRSPAAQRAFHKPRCGGCGQFLRGDSYYENRCSDCWTPADEFVF